MSNCNCSWSNGGVISGASNQYSMDVDRISFTGDFTGTSSRMNCRSEQDSWFTIKCKTTNRGPDSGSSPMEIVFIALTLFFFVVAVILYVKLKKARNASNPNQP